MVPRLRILYRLLHAFLRDLPARSTLRPDVGARRTVMLLTAMAVLGLAGFAAMLAFVTFCDRV
jgi:hypothetical protein